MSKKFFNKAISLLLIVFSFQMISAQTNFHGLVLLIDFSDKPANVTLERANNIINGVGYTEPTVTSSLRDYWNQQSRGKIVLTHQIFGYYRAPLTAATYNTLPWSATVDMYRQALNWVVATNPGFNWNSLSLASGAMNRNGTEEGTFLSINFMTTEWIPGSGGTHWLQGWTAPNGVPTQQIVGATFISPWDTNVNLFWLTHEQGHSVWGWPDTYDNNAISHGTGLYSLMSGNQSSGDIEPVGAPFLATEKWVNIIDLTIQSVVLTQDGNAVARYRNPADSLEYFVIEARMKNTIGNSSFPDERGLLIWHVDDKVTTSNMLPQMTPSQHYRVSLEQADGLFHLERFINTGDAADLYKPGLVFDNNSIPNSKWWDGTASTLSISNIQFLSNNRISFNAAGQLPAIPSIIVNPSATVCNPTTITLTANSSGCPSCIYSWSTGATGTSITVSSSGTYTVTATNAFGSTNANQIITVNTIPAQPGTISGNNSICQGSSQTYSVAVVPGATSYTWTLPSGWTGTSTTNSITTTVGNTSGSMLVKANNSCGSSTDRTLAITVNISPAQPGTISGANSLCQGSSQTYSVTAVSGATSYTWTLPSGWTGTSTTNSINTTIGNTSGSILVKANNSCGSSTDQTLAITVNPIPNQPTAITGNSNVLLAQTLNYSIAALPSATSYNWQLSGGGTIQSGQSTTTVSIYWTTAGIYNLTINGINNCGNGPVQTLPITVSVGTGIVNPDNQFEIKVAPNPTSGEFYFKVKGVSRKIIKTQILNNLGQVIYNSEQKVFTNDFTKIIDLKRKANGVYFILFRIDTNTYLRKILKTD